MRLRKTASSIFVAVLLVLAEASAPAEDRIDALHYSRGAVTWILSLARSQESALTWPVNNTDKKEPSFNLYSGMPGGILLLAELGREDASGPFKDSVGAAIAGLERLQVAAGDYKTWGVRSGDKIQSPTGLYTGTAGIAWLYLELHRITGNPSYLSRARAVTEEILRRTKELQAPELWDNSTDVISGAAGIGLFLLRAASDFKDSRCQAMAVQAGDFLLSEAIQTPTGLKWKINAGTPKLYPNFSHGTSGVAYFLVRLYQATGQRRFLSAASRGAREMVTIASSEGNGCTWYHHEGDGENLWYVSWCHGPAGTARLFYEMARTTKQKAFMDWVDRSANWLLASGIPDPPKPINGYWNESICCGTAGIGDFYLDLYLTTGKQEYLRAAEIMAAHLARVADTGRPGYRWNQAENRVSPEKKDSQTGYAQGAAGFGLFFLKLSRAQRGVPVGWRLPDNPF